MSLQFLKNALQSKNVKAFLMMIRYSEGTFMPDGYKYLFGSSPMNTLRFYDFSKHPNVARPFGKEFSTAAGAYQILYPTYEELSKHLGLTDFTPDTQDLMCCELISQRNALQLVVDGKFSEALFICGKTWASLPNNTYGQPSHPIAFYSQWYAENGGITA